MPRKRYSTEQIVTKLRQAEVELGRGLRTPQVCKKLGVSEQTYYRWRKEYGGLRLDQAKRLKALEQENTRPVNTIGLVVLSRSRECWIVPPASRIYNFGRVPLPFAYRRGPAPPGLMPNTRRPAAVVVSKAQVRLGGPRWRTATRPCQRSAVNSGSPP